MSIIFLKLTFRFRYENVSIEHALVSDFFSDQNICGLDSLQQTYPYFRKIPTLMARNANTDKGQTQAGRTIYLSIWFRKSIIILIVHVLLRKTA